MPNSWDFLGGPVTKLCAPSASGPGTNPGQGTRIQMVQLKILHATTKNHCSKINK